MNYCKSSMETLRSVPTDKNKRDFEIERKISSEESYSEELSP